MKYSAVLFDFDYTLGDATASIYDGFCYSFEKLGYPKPDLEAVRHTVGLLLEDSFTRLTGVADPDKREEFRLLFKGHVSDRQAEMTVLFPGAYELLQALHQKGVKLGIVTSKHLDTTEKILKYHKIREFADFVIGGEVVKHPKPDPEGLNLGIEALGADRDRVLYCGDTTIDAQTAQTAGVDFAAVLNGVTPAEDFRAYPSVMVAQDLPALRQFLGV